MTSVTEVLTGSGNFLTNGGGCHEIDIDVLGPWLRPLRSTGCCYLSTAKRLAAKRQLTTQSQLAPGFYGLEPGYA